MQFASEQHKCKFIVPDRPTVRQQLAYYSAASGDTLFRFWMGAKAIIEKWECELMPLEQDLEKVTDPSITSMIIWVGLEVSKHMSALEDIPKNS